ncbi:MAG TPA: alpha/beta fold hydrolase, partial [Solirubrobacterales bacterium]|nr:alpha/beta fold hydrolase [Solirubrobacterales bacterium]
MPLSDYGLSDGRWRQIDWREHLERIDLEGARSVNYVDIGEGPPILFVHGLGGCWQNWLENIPSFALSNRVVAPDLPGFGASPMPDWDISMPAYGRAVAELCERLELGPETVVVGNSMGGFISTEIVIG